MKIVATSDTHFPFDPVEDGDVLIHAGDLMMDGGPQEWHARVESLRAQPHKTKIYVPGNHDFHVELYQGVAIAELRRAGITVLGLTRSVMQVEDVRIAGLPWVTGLQGWAFNRDEQWLYDYMRTVISPARPDIIISHEPVFNILDAIHPEMEKAKDQVHVGSLAYNKWFHDHDTVRPKIWINGHIHESYGTTEHEGTRFYNVAMCDRNYEQVNPPIVVEI